MLVPIERQSICFAQIKNILPFGIQVGKKMIFEYRNSIILQPLFFTRFQISTPETKEFTIRLPTKIVFRIVYVSCPSDKPQ